MIQARVGPARVWCSDTEIGNVGDHVGDDPAAVARNRAVLAKEAGLAEPDRWVWLRQVHGNRVHVADHPTPVHDPPEADAALTATRGLPLAVVTADCAPLVLASDDAVAVVHAGHRGLANGIIERTVATVRVFGGSAVHAFLGPCIRAEHYEFGKTDLERFVDQFGPVAGTTTLGNPALDIPAVIRVILERVDVTTFEDCAIDTAADPHCFSYRVDPQTGRQATVAVLP